MTHITIGHSALNLQDFTRLLDRDYDEIRLDDQKMEKIRQNHNFLVDFASNKVIYGVNTGFGPMAQYIVPQEDRRPLQYNLIRSHTSGMGEKLSVRHARATMISRLNSLLTAHSGIHEDVIILLKDMLQHDVIPVIYSHGGVGASGDLVQLAHVALGMIGEGEVHFQGQIRHAGEVFNELDLVPMDIHMREGLALMNGTSAMTGIGIANLIEAKKQLDLSITLSSMINEIVGAFDDHMSELLNGAKHHKGQMDVAAKMRDRLKNSGCIKSRSEHLYKEGIKGNKLDSKLQEYYSIRCVPQILGAISDTMDNTEKVLFNELNSSNDNPLVFDGEGEVFHGGNFHGDYVSFEMDKLKIGITKLSMLAERQLNYLLNDRLNEILPPFINRGRLGFNFGLQGCQFTATSTVAENQMLSNPMYVHSISCNNDNQDIVSMGTNAALIAHKVISNTFDVLAIQTLAVVRAVAYLKLGDELGTATQQFYKAYESYTIIPDQDIGFSAMLYEIRTLLSQN